MSTKSLAASIMPIIGFCLFVSGLIGIYHLKDGGMVVCAILASCGYITVNGKSYGIWNPMRKLIGLLTTLYGLYYIFSLMVLQ